MPIYEYECTSCKTRFERSQRFSDPPVTECPECGSQVRRVLFPAGIVFKGSGWYITDSRPAVASAPSESTPAARGESASNGSAGGEGKPDTARKEGAAKTDTAPAKSGSAASGSSSGAKSA
jgi:putative FmdB family regulatory protein